jgi:hypothetical protein
LSVVGIGLPYITDVQVSDDLFVSIVAVSAMLVVAFANFALARFILLPAQFRAYRDPPAGRDRAHYAEFAQATTVIAHGVPSGIAVVGAWAAVFAGQGLLMLPFTAIALVSHVWGQRYLRESLETLRRDISVGLGA